MPEQSQPIHTERLELHLMTPPFLEVALSGDRARAAQLLGVTIPAAWWPISPYTQLRLGQAQHDPTVQPWLDRAIVLRQQQTMVGHINFHTKPDPDYLREFAPGGIEIGYTIFPQFRRQGYATEACAALMTWGQQQGVTHFILSISPQNQPSLRIAAHLGFVMLGAHLVEEDGVEYLYERRFEP